MVSGMSTGSTVRCPPQRSVRSCATHLGERSSTLRRAAIGLPTHMRHRRPTTLRFRKPKIKWRRASRQAATNRNRDSQPSFWVKVLKVSWFIWRMQGRWAMYIDGKEDPRRFKDWAMMNQVIKGELALTDAECMIVCRRVTHRPAPIAIVWWAIKRSWTHVA